MDDTWYLFDFKLWAGAVLHNRYTTSVKTIIEPMIIYLCVQDDKTVLV